jgi:Zn-dependent alcohol dehydrogenase
MRNGTTRLKKGSEAIHSFFCQSSFAEYCIAEEDFTIKLPAALEADKVVGLCCGGASGIGAVLNKARVWPGAQVTVMGCGGVGMGAIMAAKLAGAVKIIAVDTLDQKLQFARQFGATHTINAVKENAVEAVRQLTGGGTDFAIEAIGKAETIAQSLDLLRPGGTSVVVGAVPFGKKASIDPIQLLAEKTLAGSTIGTLKPHFDIPKYVELYMAGQLPIDKIIQAEFRLDQINEAIAAVERGEFIKTIIRMQ